MFGLFPTRNRKTWRNIVSFPPLSEYLPYTTEFGTPCDTETKHACIMVPNLKLMQASQNMDLIYLHNNICFVNG